MGYRSMKMTQKAVDTIGSLLGVLYAIDLSDELVLTLDFGSWQVNYTINVDARGPVE
jgi:hypothetical protein